MRTTEAANMETPPTKPKRKRISKAEKFQAEQSEALAELVDAFMVSVGATVHAARHEWEIGGKLHVSHNDWRIVTRLGPVKVCVHDDWIHDWFQDHRKAEAAGFDGKWNVGPYTFPETTFERWSDKFRTILLKDGEVYVPSPPPPPNGLFPPNEVPNLPQPVLCDPPDTSSTEYIERVFSRTSLVEDEMARGLLLRELEPLKTTSLAFLKLFTFAKALHVGCVNLKEHQVVQDAYEASQAEVAKLEDEAIDAKIKLDDMEEKLEEKAALEAEVKRLEAANDKLQKEVDDLREAEAKRPDPAQDF